MGSIQQEFDAAHVLSKYGVDVGAILKEGQTVVCTTSPNRASNFLGVVKLPTHVLPQQ